MSTKLTIVAPLTTISGNGQVDFDGLDLGVTTVGELKGKIELESDIPITNQDLWWRGYRLDDDALPLTKALVGVNEGEIVEAGTPSLLIFMTETPSCDNNEDKDSTQSSVSSSLRRLRQRIPIDIEIARSDIRKKKDFTVNNSCSIL